MSAPNLPLPKAWPTHVKSAVLHVISIARVAMAYTRAWSDNCPNERIRLKAELDRKDQLLAWILEEMSVKDARWIRVPNRKRPHYDPPDRMRILKLRAARGWTVAETARRFHVTETTIQNWMTRLDEDGPAALVQIREPVNKFPDFVSYMVRSLKALCPHLKPKKMTQLLCRAGLHLGPTTVRRMLRPKPKRRPAKPELATAGFRRTKTPNGLWHVDITTVSTTGGLWTPWLPLSMPPIWPFCWHVAVAVDHFSRRIMSVEVFRTQPTSRDMTRFLNRAIQETGATPQKILTDKGGQFWKCRHWLRWCQRRNIKPSFGALKVAGGICVVERVIRTLKSECCRRLAMIPENKHKFVRELLLFADWYNTWRPNEGLEGAAPDEIYFRRRPKHKSWEPRVDWKRGSACAGTNTLIKGQPGVHLEMDVEYVGGRKHLPIVKLRAA